jgi:uncharacterized protein (TIGR03067 family)
MVDNDQLNGVWRHTSFEHNGEKLTEEAVGKMPLLKIMGAVYYVKEGAFISKGEVHCGQAGAISTIDFSPQRTPYTYGETIRGIYNLGDNELIICLAKPGRDRPLSFQTLPGSESSLTSLKRETQS